MGRGALNTHTHTHHLSYTPLLSTCNFFIVLIVVWSKAKLARRACLLGRSATLGMNTMKSSSIFKLSYPLYNNAYELEYSLDHVIIVIYELVYSLCFMIITCSSLFFIIHMPCMNSGSTRIGTKVRCAFELAHVLACQSIGLGLGGTWVVSLYTAVVLGCTEAYGYDDIPQLRGRHGQVVIAQCVPCTPTSRYCVGVLQNLLRLLVDRYSEISPLH